MIHFRMQCRDSVGTVSAVNHLQPISNRVQWNLGRKEGFVATDSDGYGQIRMISSISPKAERMRLTIKKKYLGVTAGETQRIVTPGDWCKYAR